MSPSNPEHKMRVGEVMLSDEVTFNRGVARAGAGAKVLSIFLGTVEDDQEIDVFERLDALGWTRNIMYEVVAQFTTDQSKRVIQLHFLADSPKEATINGIDLTLSGCTTAQKQYASEGLVELETFSIRPMRVGKVVDGCISTKWGNPIAGWSTNDGRIEDFKEQVKNA